MKGAIGNALILNMVITFMIIFFSLLIGSMAYSKAYKVKNYLVNQIDMFEKQEKTDIANNINQKREWNNTVNEFLGKTGYTLTTKSNSCPTKEGYTIYRNNKVGEYDYCIYRKYTVENGKGTIKNQYNYMVLAYMKLELPVIGNYIKLSITGETQTYTYFN